MRYSRQNKILELIEEHEVETQSKMSEILKEHGYDVTQATISRDIKELRLIKTLASSGKYKYASRNNAIGPISNRFIHIFRETVKSVDQAGNLIVVKTLSGCGSAAGEVVDCMEIPHLIGSVAGDNTVLVIIDDAENTNIVAKQFTDMLE